MKKILLIVSGILATIPGLATLTGQLPTPPGQEILFGAVAEILGVGTILLLLVRREWVEKISKEKTTKITIVLGLFLMVFFALNFTLQGYTIMSEEGRSSVFLPLWPGDDLTYMIEEAGSRQEALTRYGAASLWEASKKTPFFTGLTLFFVLLVHQLFLLIPVVLCCGLALRVGDNANEPQ